MDEVRIQIEAQPQQPPVTSVESPPQAQRPPVRDEDPALRLHQLARELMRTRTRRLMIEYLRLRRAAQ